MIVKKHDKERGRREGGVAINKRDCFTFQGLLHKVDRQNSFAAFFMFLNQSKLTCIIKKQTNKILYINLRASDIVTVYNIIIKFFNILNK